MKVAICVATLARPAQLARLLRSLAALRFVGTAPTLRVFAIDNDAACSSRQTVTACSDLGPHITYLVEPQRGISYARNHALSRTREYNFVAFVDDDEEVTPQWLEALLAVQHNFAAPIVAGPVVPKFLSSAPQWIVDGRFFDRPSPPSGTRMRSAGAGNVLLSRRVIDAMAPQWFDPSYALTGGEDTHFFRRCLKNDFDIVWAEDAVAYEELAPDRLTEGYLRRRVRNTANQWTRVDLDLKSSLPARLMRFSAGCLRLSQGAAATLAAPFLPLPQRVRGKLRWDEGLGNLSAFFGRTYSEYASRPL